MKYKIKDVANIRAGIFKTPGLRGEVRYLQLKHFDGQRRFVGEGEPEIEMSASILKHLLTENNVLFAAKGDKNFAVVYHENMGEAIASPSFLVMQVCPTLIFPDYLVWYLNNSELTDKLKAMAIGTNILSVSKKAMENFEINVPSLSVQKQILEFHALFQQEVETLKKITALKERYADKLLMDLAGK